MSTQASQTANTSDNKTEEQKPLSIADQKKQYTRIAANFNTYLTQTNDLAKRYADLKTKMEEGIALENVAPVSGNNSYLTALLTPSPSSKPKSLGQYVLDTKNPLFVANSVTSVTQDPVTNLIETRNDGKFVKPVEGSTRNTVQGWLWSAQAHFTGNITSPEADKFNGLNIKAYKNSVSAAIAILNEPLRRDIRYLTEYLKEAKKILENNKEYRQSMDPSRTTGFAVPAVIDEIIAISEDITKRIDKLKTGLLEATEKVSDDLAKNITLANEGYVEDPNNPGTFIQKNVEKDPWGIRFTIITGTTTGREVVQSINKRLDDAQNQNNSKKNEEKTPEGERQKAKVNQPTKDEEKEKNKTRAALNNNLLDGTNLITTKSYYMHLLPAIRSNLPLQGGTDVPGAQPGLNFRIEHSVVKHKIPGFQPIYQPMGVDCIKCTIVGCFTGADGLDLWNEQKQIRNAREKKFTTIPVELWGRGDFFESLGKNIRAPGDSTGNNIYGAARAYDAFKNAQQFYNLIVAPGKEVEVEINMKKNEMVTAGGGEGAFRNATSGNPQFKALIKRMDLYYVRADRCWYILDLEITDGGLIGNECVNLTKELAGAREVLEENLLEEAQSDQELIDFRNCIDEQPNKVVLKSNVDTQRQFVIDLDTGFGYQGLVDDNTITKKYTPKQLADLFATTGSGANDLDEFGGFLGLQNQISLNGKASTKIQLLAIIMASSLKVKRGKEPNSDIKINKDEVFVTNSSIDSEGNTPSFEIGGGFIIGFDQNSKRFVRLQRSISGLGTNGLLYQGTPNNWNIETFLKYLASDNRIPRRDINKAVKALQGILSSDLVEETSTAPCSTESLERDLGKFDANNVRTKDGKSSLLVEAFAPRFASFEDCTQSQVERARAKSNINFNTELNVGTALIGITAGGAQGAYLATAAQVVAAKSAITAVAGSGVVSGIGGGLAVPVGAQAAAITLTNTGAISVPVANAAIASLGGTAAQAQAIASLTLATQGTLVIAGGVVFIAAAIVIGGVSIWRALDQKACNKEYETAAQALKDTAMNDVTLVDTLKSYLNNFERDNLQILFTDAMVKQILEVRGPIKTNIIDVNLLSEGKVSFNQNYVSRVSATFDADGTKNPYVKINNVTYPLGDIFAVQFGFARSSINEEARSNNIKCTSLRIFFSGRGTTETVNTTVSSLGNYNLPGNFNDPGRTLAQSFYNS